jgi:aminomethyltransferase
MCCDATGGVVDDLIAYLRSDDDVFLIPNAANTTEVVERLQAAAPDGITVTNRHEEFGIIAVQGPRSTAVLEALGLPTDHAYMSFVAATWQGEPVTVCRTGYTGEHGYEVVCAWDQTGALWDALVDAMAPFDGLVCGLGSRDTLRTEMGYPLHGHELSLEISPVQARVGWAVGWKKDSFWGREALLVEKPAPTRLSRGLRVTGRGIPRPDCEVSREGVAVGVVTSGTFSPTLKQGIALALLAPDVQDGETVSIDVRGRAVEATVVKPPFVQITPSS